jgi:hypothetical protein
VQSRRIVKPCVPRYRAQNIPPRVCVMFFPYFHKLKIDPVVTHALSINTTEEEQQQLQC